MHRTIAYGRGKVLIVWTQPAGSSNPTVCTVKPGTPVFFFTYGAFCSTVDSPPYYAVGYEAQRDCAVSAMQQCGCHPRLVSVDGGPAVDTATAPYFAVTSQVTAVIPPDNIFGVPPQTATLVGAAYVAMIRPLPPGQHVISAAIPGYGDQVATVDVVPGGGR